MEGCPRLEGNPWSPAISQGSVPEARDADATRYVVTEHSESGPLTGIAQGISGREVSFSFGMEEEIGPRGSIQLTAQVEGVDPRAEGVISAVLVSLHDGNTELIKLPRSGASGDCATRGFFKDTELGFDRHDGCRLQGGSAYVNDAHWWRFQSNVNDRFLSVNTLPACDWDAADGHCRIKTLRAGPGVTYRAKYVILARRYQTIPEDFTGKIRLSVARKLTSGASTQGRVDLNVVLVGAANVKASRTEAGRRNLNEFLNTVQGHYAQAGAGIRIGKVRVFEWGCAEGGEAYSSTTDRELAAFLKAGSALVDGAGGQPGWVNLFLVNRIEAGDSSLTILGSSGGIGGPLVARTGASGVVFSTFERLDQVSPGSAEFVDMGSTISHELGHFLGLAHVSERAPDSRGIRSKDWLDDTPACQKGDTRTGRSILTAMSCSQDTTAFAGTGKSCSQVCTGYDGTKTFCPAQAECEFNHVMWWTAKGYDVATGRGDGNLFSTKSGITLRLSPFVK